MEDPVRDPDVRDLDPDVCTGSTHRNSFGETCVYPWCIG